MQKQKRPKAQSQTPKNTSSNKSKLEELKPKNSA